MTERTAARAMRIEVVSDSYHGPWLMDYMNFKSIANCCPRLKCLTLDSVITAREQADDLTRA
jgi:hypothetical protein